MQLGNTVHFNSFKWVKEELRQLLLDIQRQLELYVNNPEGTERLDQIISSLRQVRGTLSLVEIYGAALLSEEMELVARALKTDEIPNLENAYEVLLNAAIKLPDYLESLAAGNKDIPMVLLPLLNDLRACRNASLLSENVLFFPDVNVATGTFEPPEGLTEPTGNPAELARKLRHSYQLGLLGWFRDQKTEDAFKRMHAVVNKLRAASREDGSSRLWWVAMGIVEALQNEGVEHSVALKSLMGKVDRQIKYLADNDEVEFTKSLPDELTKNLLYYAARAEPVTENVVRIKNEFNLAKYLPKDSELESAEQRLGGPNQELLGRVAEAIQEDINQAKDALDAFVHSGSSDLSRLQPLPSLYAKIADTLGMLGLGHARESVLQEKAGLESQLSNETGLDEETQMSAASNLLSIEGELDAYVNNRVTMLMDAADGAGMSAEESQAVTENQHVITSLVNESLRDIVLVKDAFLNFIDNPDDVETIKLVPDVLKELSGAMFVAPLEKAAPVIGQLRDYFNETLINGRHLPGEQEQDVVADVVTNIECFLEAVAENRVDSELFVVAANEAFNSLQRFASADEMVARNAAAADKQESQPFASEELVVDESDLLEDDPVDVDIPVAADEPRISIESVVLTKNVKKNYDELQIIGEDADEEIIDVFIEEALEELEKVRSFFPVWRNDSGDREAITTIRRSFHTLKGSGRLIGATLIGEFSWSIENMLNRLIDGTIKESPQLFAVVEEALGILAQLIDQIRGDSEPVENVFEVMQRADEIAADRLPVNPKPDHNAALADAALPGSESAVAEDGPQEVEELLSQPENDVPEPISLADNVVSITGESLLGETTALNLDDEAAFDADESDAGIVLEELSEQEEVLQEDQDGKNIPKPDLTGEYLRKSIDPTLLDIFSDEAQTHITEIKRISSKARDEKLSTQNVESLIRALHTLHGSARTAKFTVIAEKAKLLEQHANNLAELDKPWSPEELSLLDRAADYIGSCIAHLKDNTAELQPETDLDQRLLDCLTRSEREVSLKRQEGKSDRTDSLETLDVDTELVDIFLEEAPDIVNTIEHELQEWKSREYKPEHITEIMRQLHTLKGSARMANLSDIGDLSHAMESLFVAISTDKIEVNSTLVDMLMEAVDLLGGMLDGLRQGLIPVVPDEYIERLENIRLGKTTVIEQSPDILPESESEPVESEIDISSDAMFAGLEPELPATEEPESEQEAELGVEVAFTVPTEQEEPADSFPFAPQVDDSPGGGENVIMPFEGGGESQSQVEQMPTTAPLHEQIRVRADKLDTLVNNAGEVNIYHSRLGQYVNDLHFNLNELEQTVARLQRQIRDMDMQTEAQIASRIERETENPYEDFDPLEMDRYSHMQQLSRAMAESASDLDNIKSGITELVRNSEVVLQQQSRVSTELQEDLLQTRMVKFQGLASRLRRIVRQTAMQLNKKVELRIIGADNEIDRSVQERMLAPLEHMLRNAVFHGVETTEQRLSNGKPEQGVIRLDIERDGSYIVLSVADDGRGIDPARIRQKAIQLGLLGSDETKSDHDVIQYILYEGFSTADDVSQIAGRGVGMDVVDSEIKQLGGSLSISSQPGKGSVFNVRLPLTLAINQALLVQLGDDIYAIPSASIEGVALLNASEVEENLVGKRNHYEYAGEKYQMHYLGSLLGLGSPSALSREARYPLLLIRSGQRRVGVHVDMMVGRREIVVKPVGPQITAVPGISGATILADGRVALILDVTGLVSSQTAEILSRKEEKPLLGTEAKQQVTVMVVDDSITIRKVTARILGRHNLKVVTAKDGLDAVQQLQDFTPDLFLMDIEMPRMDGFELASHVRSDSRLQGVPIIMITSRTGDKHRERARKIGVDRYLGKPFQENELMNEINELLEPAEKEE